MVGEVVLILLGVLWRAMLIGELRESDWRAVSVDSVVAKVWEERAGYIISIAAITIIV